MKCPTDYINCPCCGGPMSVTSQAQLSPIWTMLIQVAVAIITALLNPTPTPPPTPAQPPK